MKAVILAAGKGERLGTIDRPKALERLLGLSLVERAILSAKEAGIKEFCVAVGYRGEDVMAELGDGERLGVKIEYVENKRWDKGNSYSVLAAKGKVNGKFLLLMSDHVFDPEALKRLREVDIEEGCVLCIDRDLAGIFDLEEATKVFVEGDKIKLIGKGLREFNGVDCGILLCTGDVFRALNESVASGREELSHAVALLASEGRARAFDITGLFWHDIDTPADLDEAERRMLRSLIKREDGIISRLLNRRISIRISKRLVDLTISPNTLSFLAFFTGIVAALLFFTGKYTLLALGGLLAQASSILDGCDGEVARLKFLQSKRGAWLDSVLDRYADALLILGLTYYGWSLEGINLIWGVGFVALVGSFAVSYTRARYESVFSSSIPSGLEIPVKRDGRLFILMIGALLNQALYTLLILAILTHAEVARRLISWRGAG